MGKNVVSNVPTSGVVIAEDACCQLTEHAGLSFRGSSLRVRTAAGVQGNADDAKRSGITCCWKWSWRC